MTDSPADLTLAAAARALRSGDLSSVELLDAVLSRATLTEAQLHCYLRIDHTGARAAAIEADRMLAAGDEGSPLLGIPVALKDNMCTRGVETTCGSQILAGYLPPYDATVVARLRRLGAVITGKANLDEFAMGSSTENSAYGPTRNPWDTERVPGGSSGGAAAAVAVGSAIAGLGSDTGGSIRQPASLCGVVGMKPTYGLVSRYGLVAFASSLDQIGPLARTVEDAALLLEAIWGHDSADATSYRGEPPSLAGAIDAGVEGPRIGVVTELSQEGIDPAVAASFADTLTGLESAGAVIEEVSLPTAAEAVSIYYLIAPAEASSNLARFDGVRYGLRVDGANAEQMMARTRAEGFGPEVTRRVLLGTYALSAGYYDAFYGQAQRARTLLIGEFENAYGRFDALVSPTSPSTAFPLGAKTQDPLTMYMSDVCTIPSNLAGHPAISVPSGADADGLPIGFQVMAPALGEAVLFRVAGAVERLRGAMGRPVVEAVAS